MSELNKPLDMSIYDRPELNVAQKDSESKFLSKALGDGDSMTLTLVEIFAKVRGEDTKVQKPGDSYIEIELTDENGKTRIMEQNSRRGAFFVGMKAAGIEPGDKFLVTRSGTGIESAYQMMKMSADGLPEPKKDEPAF